MCILFHIYFLFAISTISVMFSAIVPHQPYYKLLYTSDSFPTMSNKILCDTKCVSCTHGTQNWSLPLCVNVPLHVEGRTECIGVERDCNQEYQQQFDNCIVLCQEHTVLRGNITLRDVPKSRIVYEHDCGLSIQPTQSCSFPTSIRPPFYTFTPALLVVFVSSLLCIVLAIGIDIYLLKRRPRYCPATPCFLILWTTIITCTCLSIYA